MSRLGISRNDTRTPRLPKDPEMRRRDKFIREWAKNNGVSIGVARECWRMDEETKQQENTAPS